MQGAVRHPCVVLKLSLTAFFQEPSNTIPPRLNHYSFQSTPVLYILFETHQRTDSDRGAQTIWEVMAGLISVLHAECVQSFETLLWTLQHPSRNIVTPEYSENVRNEFGRYKVWAGNVGAPHQGRTYRLSLDYRLRDASFYQDRASQQPQDTMPTASMLTSSI